MHFVILGGHGRVALPLAHLLVEAGHRVDSVVRNADHASDVAASGAAPVIADLEILDTDAMAELCTGRDAVIWSAGPGWRCRRWCTPTSVGSR